MQKAAYVTDIEGTIDSTILDHLPHYSAPLREEMALRARVKAQGLLEDWQYETAEEAWESSMDVCCGRTNCAHGVIERALEISAIYGYVAELERWLFELDSEEEPVPAGGFDGSSFDWVVRQLAYYAFNVQRLREVMA